MNKRKYLIENIKAAHKHSINHRNEILLSETCGCFYCLKIFTPVDIDQWIDKNDKAIGQTALCPACSIDSVIGSQSNYPINKEFLAAMQNHWFS
tara:strand:- start:483 stop:764 length:282 start_codon:yes stop_codon:yes gene_type:complete